MARKNKPKVLDRHFKEVNRLYKSLTDEWYEAKAEGSLVQQADYFQGKLDELSNKIDTVYTVAAHTNVTEKQVNQQIPQLDKMRNFVIHRRDDMAHELKSTRTNEQSFETLGETTYQEGKELFRQGRYEEAQEFFDIAVECGHGKACLGAASIAAFNGDHDAARDFLDMAQERDVAEKMVDASRLNCADMCLKRDELEQVEPYLNDITHPNAKVEQFIQQLEATARDHTPVAEEPTVEQPSTTVRETPEPEIPGPTSHSHAEERLTEQAASAEPDAQKRLEAMQPQEAPHKTSREEALRKERGAPPAYEKPPSYEESVNPAKEDKQQKPRSGQLSPPVTPAAPPNPEQQQASR